MPRSATVKQPAGVEVIAKKSSLDQQVTASSRRRRHSYSSGHGAAGASSSLKPASNGITGGSSEVDSLKRIIKEDRKSEKGRAIIAVVERESMSELERRCQTKKWKFWAGKAIVRVTTPNNLQTAIEAVQRDPSRDNTPPRHITILASSGLATLPVFHVNAHVTTLSIFRHEDSTLAPPSGNLFLAGESSLGGMRLDAWGAKRHRRHAVYVGRGVGIQIDEEALLAAEEAEASQEVKEVSTTQKHQPQIKSFPNWSTACTLSLTDAQKGEVYELFNSLYAQNNNQDGTQSKSKNGKPWHERWIGPISTLIGLATGAKKTGSMRATAAGMFVEWHFGSSAIVQAGAVGMPAMFTAAAGPAMLLGVGAAAAAYFIPWDVVFKWLWDVLKKLCCKVLELFEKLVRWVGVKLGLVAEKTVGGKAGQQAKVQSGRFPGLPMEFAGR